MGSGGDVGAESHGNLPELTVARGDNPRVLQINLRQLQRGFCALDVGLQRAAIDDDRLQVLTRHLKRRFGLLNIGAALSSAGERRIAFANRQGAVGGQIVNAL
ncbi:hypothetical protein D3C72_955060 [compost metagenome]